MLTTIIRYVVLGVFVTGLLVFGYTQWKTMTERAAQAEQARVELAQAVKDLQATNQQLLGVMRMADEVRQDLASKKMELEMSGEKINGVIDKSDDRPSSPVLKNTVRELSNRNSSK